MTTEDAPLVRVLPAYAPRPASAARESGGRRLRGESARRAADPPSAAGSRSGRWPRDPHRSRSAKPAKRQEQAVRTDPRKTARSSRDERAHQAMRAAHTGLPVRDGSGSTTALGRPAHGRRRRRHGACHPSPSNVIRPANGTPPPSDRRARNRCSCRALRRRVRSVGRACPCVVPFVVRASADPRRRNDGRVHSAARDAGAKVSSTLSGRRAGARSRARNDDVAAFGSTPLARVTLPAPPVRRLGAHSPAGTTNGPGAERAGPFDVFERSTTSPRPRRARRTSSREPSSPQASWRRASPPSRPMPREQPSPPSSSRRVRP